MFAAAIVFLLSIFAFLTGIFAIGNGIHWQFSTADLWRGRRNAVLYLWLCATTIFSLFQSLTDYIFMAMRVWTAGAEFVWWFALNGVTSLLLITAHIYIRENFRRHPLKADRYLWGDRPDACAAPPDHIPT